jgi:AraC-like DNA-binding protein
LGDIASECGFYDQSSFTKQFRAVLGVTPGAYRRLRS